jgi:hypothetical protein
MRDGAAQCVVEHNPREPLNKSLLRSNIPSGAKARVDFATFAARLESRRRNSGKNSR